MNRPEHIDHLLHDLLDGELDEETATRARNHLAACARCRSAWDSLRGLVIDVRSLPRAIEPPRDLWEGIEARLGDSPAHVDDGEAAVHADDGEAAAHGGDGGRRMESSARENAPPRGRAYRRGPRLAVGVAAAVLVAAGAAVWFLARSGGGWGVESLEGAPLVARQFMGEQGVLRPGEWLETDDASRARLRVGSIGEVDVEPNTRVQLRRSRLNDHRIALAQGRIDARIWAPPRLFFVETPSATAIDLGCAYTLDVDSMGKSVLHVTAGYVELEKDGRSTVVPAGTMCYATPDIGPGTVFFEGASPSLRSALERFDFQGRMDDDLSIVLAEARPEDAVTLWQLVEHSESERRERIYVKLVDLVSPPSGVTLEGVLDGDEDMFTMWRLHLGLDAMSWWGYFREKVSFRE